MKSLPKVELHLHLEGAAPPAFIRGLAQEKGVRLNGVFDEHGHYAYKDFPEFLKVYEAATMALKTPDDFARLTTAVLEECAEHGVIYAETFVSPDFCGGGDVGAWRDYLAAMVEASNAMADSITLKGIVTCIRHFGPEQAKTAAICAAETAGDWVTGFGMGGAENVGNAGDYKWSFECAREAGLRLTSHAGEWGGAASVRETLDDLGVERIGHGVQCIQDSALVDRIAAEGIVLEVCPGSNVALGVVPNWASHPITKLRDAGVKVTVSTDDPPFFHTTMTHEFDRLAETHRWDDDAIRAVNITAAEAAFCDDATRADLIKKLETQ